MVQITHPTTPRHGYRKMLEVTVGQTFARECLIENCAGGICKVDRRFGVGEGKGKARNGIKRKRKVGVYF